MKMNKVLLTTAIVASISSCAFASGSNTGYNNVSNGDYGSVIGSNNVAEATATSSMTLGDTNVTKMPNSLTFGQGNINNGENSFVGGDKSKAVGRDTFAFGSSAEALVDYTVAIGSQARTNAYDTIAIGNGAYVSGESSVVLGRTNTVTGADSVVVGANNGTISAGQTAIVGYNNKVLDDSKEQLIFGSNSQTKGQGTVAIGTHASATQIDALAFGNNTIADVQNGVAVGTNSVTELAVGTSTVKDNATDIRFSNSNFAGNTPDSVVSFGTHGRAGAGGVTEYTRQLQNVSAGRVSSTSTDAVNGSQLYDVALEAQKYNTLVDGVNTTVTSKDNDSGRKEYKVNVNKTLKDMDAVEFGKVTDNTHAGINKDGAYFFNGSEHINIKPTGIQIENTDTLTQATFNNEGMQVSDDNATIRFTTTDISAGGQQIHDVKAGTKDTDVVNVKQLKDTISNVGDSISVKANNYTDKQVAHVGANAAALSALHPLSFNPNEKVEYSVGYGNYKGSNAVAVGVFAHPNENTLLSLGATFGTGDNMINAGATFRVGKSYKQVTNSNVAVAKDVQDLAKKYEALAQKYDNLVKSLNHTNGTDYDVVFPDVPKGHWAYDFVKDLSDKGYLVGYPDGTFKGDKSMTRYEFATAVYRALQNGALMDANMVKAIKEFKPELKDVEDAQRFVIKHESGSGNEIHKVERVNVNTKNVDGMYRDVYGTNLKA
jgi:autotransporter adhesin